MAPGNVSRLITLSDRKAKLKQAKAREEEATRRHELYLLDLEERFGVSRAEIQESTQLVRDGISKEGLKNWASLRGIPWIA